MQALKRHKKSLEAESKYKHNTTNSKKIAKALDDLKRCQSFIKELRDAPSDDLKNWPF